MTNAITFDKLAYVERLKESGFTQDQAKGAADALDSALKDSVATKHDIELLRRDMAKLEVKLSMLQWMVGGIGVGVLLLVIKSFLPV